MANAHDDGDARSAMAELATDMALCAEKAREGNGAVSAFGRRWLEVEDNGQRLQISHGAWQHD